MGTHTPHGYTLRNFYFLFFNTCVQYNQNIQKEQKIKIKSEITLGVYCRRTPWNDKKDRKQTNLINLIEKKK